MRERLARTGRSRVILLTLALSPNACVSPNYHAHFTVEFDGKDCRRRQGSSLKIEEARDTAWWPLFHRGSSVLSCAIFLSKARAGHLCVHRYVHVSLSSRDLCFSTCNTSSRINNAWLKFTIEPRALDHANRITRDTRSR